MDQSIKDVLKMQMERQRLDEQLENLSKSSDSVKKALEFQDELRALLKKYGFKQEDLVEMLQIKTKATASKRVRKNYVYRNPHTGEVVKTRGGNHVTLNQWREKYGAEKVDSWKEVEK